MFKEWISTFIGIVCASLIFLIPLYECAISAEKNKKWKYIAIMLAIIAAAAFWAMPKKKVQTRVQYVETKSTVAHDDDYYQEEYKEEYYISDEYWEDEEIDYENDDNYVYDELLDEYLSVEETYWYETPDSTAISEIGYWWRFHVLYITFRNSGETYEYYDVPPEVWYNIRTADSIGRYFNEYIKGHYEYEKW